MSAVHDAEKAVRELSGAELEEFRRWFYEFDGRAWDAQFEADVEAGKLDELARDAIAELRSGRTRPL
jgi:hypothetical protein